MRSSFGSFGSGSVLIIAGALALGACGGDGGGSGVDGAKPIISMTVSEKQTFCEWLVAEQGGPDHVTECGGGVSVTTQTVAECVAGFADFSPTCAATVAQGEACAIAVGAAPCSFGGEACAPIFACIPQS